MRRWILIVLAIVVVIGAAIYFGLVYKPAIAPLTSDQAQAFDPALVAHGSQMAAVGDCASCHTAPGGAPLAGGRAVPTPFGIIYSSNITPDRGTGIGSWSEAAFIRALQEGVARDGDHLYPAFPFDHFTHATVDDDKAIYAYLMTRDPVNFRPPPNQLAFPFNIRAIMAGWDLLFLKKGPLAEVPDQSAEWNRGRYLIEGLGHCGACHTPRNSLGAEDTDRQYAGGPVVDGWFAYPIDEATPAPGKWTVEALAGYLRAGFARDHGVSRGPMTQVTARLRDASDEDVHAMAVYVAALMGSATTSPPAPPPDKPTPILTSGDSLVDPGTIGASSDRGAMIYAAACSSCHESGRPPPFGGIDFHKSTAVNADSLQNIVNMVLFGLPAAEGRSGAVMPGFAGTLSQDDVVALLGFLRTTFGNGKPAWPDMATIVADTMNGTTAVVLYGQDGVARAAPAINPKGAAQ